MHVVNSLGTGGLENGLVNIISGTDPARFEHVVCAIRGLGANAERLDAERTKIVSLARPGRPSRFQTPALVRVIRQCAPDIVHSRNWAAIEAVVAARLARAPSVVHSEHGFEANEAAGEPARRRYFRRIAYELADRVLAVSYQLRSLHAARTGFSAQKMAVIHNGVDARRFHPDAESRARIRADLRLGPTDICIGSVGNLLPVKDHMTLLKGLEQIGANGAKWRLLIIGEGSERPALKTFVDAHPDWAQNVCFLGSTTRVPDLLRGMDIFVLPSIAEGLCNALLEAMASGLPVVATAVGGNVEIVNHGQSGLLFPAGDVSALARDLIRLSAEPQLRAALGQGAIARVRTDFSLDAMIRAYERMYSEMAGDSAA